jgi:crotonobetainyl-CoA:carnitine CoA-transferase CaiB-like acyl-CoA transferase
MDGARFGTRLDIPRVGEHTRELLAGLGYVGEQVEGLVTQGIVHAV